MNQKYRNTFLNQDRLTAGMNNWSMMVRTHAHILVNDEGSKASALPAPGEPRLIPVIQ